MSDTTDYTPSAASGGEPMCGSCPTSSCPMSKPFVKVLQFLAEQPAADAAPQSPCGESCACDPCYNAKESEAPKAKAKTDSSDDEDNNYTAENSMLNIISMLHRATNKANKTNNFDETKEAQWKAAKETMEPPTLNNVARQRAIAARRASIAKKCTESVEEVIESGETSPNPNTGVMFQCVVWLTDDDLQVVMDTYAKNYPGATFIYFPVSTKPNSKNEIAYRIAGNW